MTFKVYLWLMNNFDIFIEFRTVKNSWSAKVLFLHLILPAKNLRY